MKNFQFYLLKTLAMLFFIFGIGWLLATSYAIYLTYGLLETSQGYEQKLKNDPAFQEKISKVQEKLKESGQEFLSDSEREAAIGTLKNTLASLGIGFMLSLLIIVSTSGLFFFKRWGLNMCLIGIFGTWVWTLIQNQGMAGNLTTLIPLSLFGIYLIAQRKFIINYNQSANNNLNPIQP